MLRLHKVMLTISLSATQQKNYFVNLYTLHSNGIANCKIVNFYNCLLLPPQTR
jgi:hypothetical protein